MGLHTSEVAMTDYSTAPTVSRAYAWLVFALTFGLLVSDYMSRQVLNAVFPLLKAEWVLSDTRLGSLSSIVALMVGVLTLPLSIVADRWGRLRSLILMAMLWSLATLGCALAKNYNEMFIARFFVGLGEAAYGSVGIALIVSIFPHRLRATLTGAFTSGGAFGSVLGVAFGGIVATRLGWRWSFGAMALFGLLLVVVYRLVVTEKRLSARACFDDGSHAGRIGKSIKLSTVLRGLFSSKSLICAYIGSGLQLFIPGALYAWLPSYLNRYYAMAPDKAGVAAAGFVLLTGAGMIGCGIISDRVSRNIPGRKWVAAIAYTVTSFAMLMIAFHVKSGALQLVLIGAGMFLSAGTLAPAGAMVANLTSPAIHASVFATLTLANNLLGLAPGPVVTGMFADRVGLLGALQIIPFVSLVALAAFLIGKKTYVGDLKRINEMRVQVPN